MPGPGHPESPMRLQAILRAVDEAAIPALVRREAPEATLEQVQRVHPARYTSRILGAVPEDGYVRVDADTVLNPYSGEAALRAAGAACAAVDAVMAGEAPGTLLRHAAARAPCRGHGGHGLLRVQQRRRGRHCRRVPSTSCRGSRSSISTCITATARRTRSTTTPTRSTSRPTSRRSIRAPASPRERGIKGNILNRPLPPGTGSEAWRRVVERDVLPAIDGWRPQLIFISAGFDAHADDPLANMRWSRTISPGSRASCAGSPTGTATAALSRSWRAAMTRRPWRAASWRTCEVLAEETPR